MNYKEPTTSNFKDFKEQVGNAHLFNTTMEEQNFGLTQHQADIRIEGLKQQERRLDCDIAMEKVKQKSFRFQAEQIYTQTAALEPRIAAFGLQAKQIDLQKAGLLPQRAQAQFDKERIELNRDRLKATVSQIQLSAESQQAAILSTKLSSAVNEARIDLQSSQRKFADKRSLLAFKGEL